MFFVVLVSAMGASATSALPPPPGDVLKATLANGLRVVIVRNTIAPVVATDLVYLVGSRDDPAGVPGMAHAQEHMMFRGTRALSTSELGTIATALGGAFNASTTDLTTQYQFSVPAGDLDAVLRIESDRMRDVLDAQAQWQNERGAIEQEVLRDESQPGGDFFRDARAIALAGSRYAHDGVGTRDSFDRLTGPQIKAFYERWYAPNNAVLVIAGNVDPAHALDQVRARFASIPRRTVGTHAVAHLAPLKRTVIRRPTTLVYALAAVGFRLPGLNDPDFLASYVLQGILDAARGPLHALSDGGEALDAEWTSLPYAPEVQVGFATVALAPGSHPDAMVKRVEGILHDVAQHGVPRELFTSTRRRLIASQEFSRNSIEQLASDWADTIAVDGEPSIEHEQQLIGQVTLDQVNRVARRYLDSNHAIIGSLTPSASASQSGAPAPPPQQLHENPLNAQPAVTRLPAWADPLVTHITAPQAPPAPSRTVLSNGITLIVQPETISDSVFLYGNVRTNPNLQEPPGKSGVSSVLDGMYPYGTRSLDRVAFQREQDDLDSGISGGSGFGMQTTSRSFDRAIALLAQNELQPRFDEPTFDLARRRAVDALATSLNGSHTIAMRQASQKLLPAGDPELREATTAGMQALSLEDVREYYAKTMRPDQATIVVVGNVTVDHAKSAVERAFGGWHASGERPNLDLPPLPINAPGRVALTLSATRQTNVTFQQIVPLTRTSPEFYPLQLGNAILGGGSVGPEQSRLFRDLRQNAGLVYTVDSQFRAHRTRAEFITEFACLPANEARIETLIDGEIERMRTEPVGDFELALMKASIVRRSVLAGASTSSIGSSLLANASGGYSLNQGTIDAQKFIATDAHAIQAAFKAYIHPQNFVRIIEGP